MTSQEQFILASASPRRQQLLTTAGYRFDVVPSSVDERPFEAAATDSVDLCQRLALAKAQDVARRFSDRVVLGADTVVDFDGQIIGKPDDAAHAEAITRKVFSKPHTVITGIALVCHAHDIRFVEAVATIVHPRRLTEAQIAAHIRGGQWAGKAGAYGIQETGDAFVDRIEGSFTNVMGLPMERVEALLEALHIKKAGG